MSFPKNFDREKAKLRNQDIRRKIERGEIKIEYAKSSRRETLRPWVAKVLAALEHPEAFVTDESSIGDFFSFPYEKEDLDKIGEVSKSLGVPVAMKDYVVDVANRIRTGNMC